MRYIGVMVVVLACAAVVGTAQPAFSPSDLGAEPPNLSGRGTGAKPPGWRNVGPTPPGIVGNIAVHPSGAVFLASMGGGVRKSNDFGATWTSVNAGLPPGALSFAMDASGPDTVYVGVFSLAPPGGVFKSTDGGTTWELSPATANIVPAALEADPSNPGIVFMGGLAGRCARRRTAERRGRFLSAARRPSARYRSIPRTATTSIWRRWPARGAASTAARPGRAWRR